MSDGDRGDAVSDAAEQAEQARAEAVDASAATERARAKAVAESEGAHEARAAAEHARDRAQSAQRDTERPARGADQPSSSQADADDLLVHPDDEPDTADEHPFGAPGEPISRHSAFYVGFMGGLGVLLALVVGVAIREVSSILVLILVSVFLAVGLNPLVEILMHRGLKRHWAVLVVTIGVLAVMTLFVVAMVPVLRDQITALIQSAPGWIEDLSRNRRIQSFDAKYDVIDKVNEKLQDPDLAQQAFGSIYTVGLAVLGAFANAFLIFVLTLYFLGALPKIKRGVYSLVPASRRTRVTYLGDEILRRVGGYVSGAFVVAVCAGVSSFIFLEIAGLGDYALALAFVVAIFDFVPLIGATIAAVLVSLIGFATDLKIGIACVIFYIVYQQIENYVIYPRVMRSSVDVPGIVTVIAVLVGGSMIGVVGAMLAIPLAAAVLLLVREVVVRKQDVS